MAEVVVVGAGIGALATALLLGREGRDVVVCERDPAPVPAAADDMWSEWARPGVPQARLGHCFLSGFRVLLEARAPDVLERLYATGAPLVDFAADMPGDERRPDDRAMTAIMCRRPILEGILRQAVQAEPTVDVRCGCDVVGLVAEPSLRGVPKVVGVRTRDHGSIAAATVVIAGGRRVPSSVGLRRSAPRDRSSSRRPAALSVTRGSSASGCGRAKTITYRRRSPWKATWGT